MKKLILILMLFVVSGCDNVMNTPTKEVEAFLSKYQTMNDKVIMQLDDVLENDYTMNDEQKKDYKELMKKQYQNLSYKIKDEKIDGNHASITTEIEVYDYNKVLQDADNYLSNNSEQFLNDDGTTDEVKFMDYKISQMKDMKDKVTYTITFTLTKENDKWSLDDITDIDRQKIHGIYDN